jgi:hypothetical protein
VIGLLWFVLAILVSPFRSKARLEAEIATLRQQLIVLQQKSRGRVRLTHGDRLLFVQLYRWFPSILPVVCTENSCMDGARGAREKLTISEAFGCGHVFGL